MKQKQFLNSLGLSSPHLSQHLLRLLLLLVTAIGGAGSAWAEEAVVSESKTWTVTTGSVSDGTNSGNAGPVEGLYFRQNIGSSQNFIKVSYDVTDPDIHFNIPGNTSGTLVVTYASASTSKATFSVKLGNNQVYSNETSSQDDVTSEAITINNTSSEVATVSFWAATKQFNVKKIVWTVGDAPTPTITITTQPTGGTYTQFATVNALTVAASASNSAALTYQWQSSSAENDSYSDISGATSASYTVSNTSTSDKWYKCIVSADGCGNEPSTAVRVKVEGGNKTTNDLTKITENYIYTPNAAIPQGTLTSDGKVLAVTGGCNYTNNGLNIKDNRYIAISVAAGATLSVTAGNHGTSGDRTLYISKTEKAQNEYSKIIAQGLQETLSVSTTEESVYYIHGSSDLYIKKITVSFGPTLYTVTYSNDAAKGNCTATTFTQETEGQGTSLPGATPKPGYTFHGWDTNGDGTADAHTGDNYTPTQDITLTAVYTNGNVVGDANEGWWSAFSNFVTLPKDNSIHLTFNNQSHGTATYNNWAMVVTTDANGHNGDGVQSGTGNELYFIRPNGESLNLSHTWTLYKDNAGHYESVTLSGDEETAFKAAMTNADVDIQVSFDGTSIYTIAKTVANNGAKYILVDKSTNNLGSHDNVYVSFTVDKCVLTFNTQNDATPSINVAVQSNDNVKGGVAAKIASGIQLPSDRPIWAGTEVVFQASANPGYTFVNWTDDDNDNAVVKTQTDFTQAITANVNWTANFAETYAYTVTSKCGEIIFDIKNGTAAAGTQVSVPYKQYYLHEGFLYQRGAQSNEFNQKFTLDTDNKVVDINYTKTAIDNVVFLNEAEEIEGMTASTANNAGIRLSNSLGGQCSSEVVITTLPVGKYKIFAQVRANSKTFNIKAGSENVWSLTVSGGNNNKTSDEFIVTTDNTTIVADAASGNDLWDYFYIIKTGDYTPVQENKVNITFTTEDKHAVAVVSTPNYGVTASVANGNMNSEGQLKIESTTSITITIPEGYTANMKFDASNNGGIKVHQEGTDNSYDGSTTSVRKNLPAGTYTITKGNSLNVSMITLELTPLSTEVAALTSVTTTATGAEVTPAGNNVWGVVVPYGYSGSTVPVTLNYEHATEFTVKQNETLQTPTASGDGTATFDFNIGTQTAPVSYTVTTGNNAGSQTYTINVLKLGREYEKQINVTDFNYYVGTSGISASDNGLDRDLNGVNFTFTGGQGVKVNSESNITVRTRNTDKGTVTIALNGSNTGAHITKVVLGGSGFTAEAANYLTMTGGQITFRNSNELMVVPTTQTNTVTFQSNGTDVNITSFTVYTDAELAFTKVTPTISINVPAQVVTTSTVTPTLTTSPKNYKVTWKLTSNGAKSTVNVQTGVIEVGKTVSENNTLRASSASNAFYNAAETTVNFATVELKIASIVAAGFEEAKTEPGTSKTVTITTTPADATVYYTTDGTDPTTSSTSGKSFTITQSTLVKAIAVMNVGGVEIVSDMASKSFNYKDPKLFNTVAVTSLSKVLDIAGNNNDYMPDQILKDGSGNDACILSWGSYRKCGLNGSVYDTTKKGDYHTLKDEPAKVQNVDGFGRVLDAQNNPKAEDGSNFSMSDALKDDPLNLPVMGSFAKLQPLYNGTATVYILQNGSSDWVYDSDKKETYQLDKLRRRPTYVVNEFGTALSNGVNEDQPEVVHAELASNAVFETKTFNAIQLAVAGTDANAFDEDTKVSTISTSNGAANVAYWQNLIKNRDWAAGGNMASSGDNSALVRTEANGFELMIKQYVKYTFPVTAGRTYFILGSGTNNGLAAAKFERTNDDVSDDAEHTITIDEDADVFSDNITSNIGKQVNVKLNRTFTKDKWYSLVLPFSMNEAQVKQYFGNVAIYWFDNTDADGNIHWKKHHYQMINAGIPVLMKVGQTFNSGTVIKNVLIQTDQIREYSFGGDYKMTGTWTRTTMPVNSYYISNTESADHTGKTYNATIYRTNQVTNTRGLRAWLSPAVSNARALTRINFSNFVDDEDAIGDTPTAIDEVLESSEEIVTSTMNNGALYNINGQRVDANSIGNLNRGIYIKNGKKFIK